MSGRPTPVLLRLLAVLMAAVLVAALVLLVLRRNQADVPAGQVEPSPTDAASGAVGPTDDLSDGATDGPGPGDDQGALDEAAALELLADVDLATQAGAEGMMAAAALVADGTWAGLDPADAVAGADVRTRPVYVAEVTVSADRRVVEAELAIAVPTPPQPTDQLVLRFLPTADAIIAATSTPPQVTATVAGLPATAELDAAGARLLVGSDALAEAGGPPALVHLQVRYEVPDRLDIVDDGGPAGFGLLAHNPDVTVLGHLLPLLTFEDGPMLPYGDVGAFPAATWSLVLHHTGTAVTGGFEVPCPGATTTDGCLWARGNALRDLPVVVFDGDVTFVAEDGVRAIGASRILGQAAAAQLVDEALAARDLFQDLFGPLAWPDLEVVVAPLTSGAAGMEFPGLVIIRTDTVSSLSGGFGTYVTVHEVAHQWFHAYVGNGSLGAPVVDESLAQYASVLFYAQAYGESAAESLSDRYFVGRYEQWRSSGAADIAPGSTLAGFGDGDVYGPMVYARGALAWVAAEERVGRDAVVGFVADLVAAHRLGEVDVATLVAEARRSAADLGAVLDRWWFDATPIPAAEIP